MIFHAALQDQIVMKKIAAEIKNREANLYCYAKKPEEKDYIELRHFELSQIYSTYIRKFATFVTSCGILELTPTKQLEFIRNTPSSDVIYIYKVAKELIEIIIIKYFSNTLFCCKYRIYRNALKLYYVDLVRLYRICYMCVTESINHMETCDIKLLKDIDWMVRDFIKLTEDTSRNVGGMASQLKEPLPAAITYFKPTPDLLKNLREFIKAKEDVVQIKEDEKNIRQYPVYQGVAPKVPAANEDEEFDLDADLQAKPKEEEGEFNLDEPQGEDFMTQVKQQKSVEETKHYTTSMVPPQVKPVPNKKSTENENELLGFAQGGTGGNDEFDKLFGGSSTNPVVAPPRPAQPPVPQARPQQSAYDQFAQFYTTYKPTENPNLAPNPYAQNPYAQPQAMPPARPANKAPTPFDEVESKYSGLQPSPSGGGNEMW